MVASNKHFRKRNAILTYLRGTTQHPSAETVFSHLKQEIPDLSMGTVYRNLNLFKAQGLVACVANVNGVERFDACTTPHVHFICTQCCAVQDLPQIKVPEQLQKTAAQQAGGSVESCQLSFSGICRDCVTNQKQGGEAV